MTVLVDLDSPKSPSLRDTLKMKFFRRKDRKKNASLNFPAHPPSASLSAALDQNIPAYVAHIPPPTYLSSQKLAQLPEAVFDRIFKFVCPHATDCSFETCEDSRGSSACLLCDMRDLAHAAMVSKRWRALALPLLYHTIHIDTLHYCQRNAIANSSRSDGRRARRRGDDDLFEDFQDLKMDEDNAAARLRLLSRTLREDPTRLGVLVLYLKIPYMLRESCPSDLARAIAVTPNLCYVDLPSAFYHAESNMETLRMEVQFRCPQMRKMMYMRGAERALEELVVGTFWRNLEVLEFHELHADPIVMRHALGSLPRLQALRVTDVETFTDDVFRRDEGLPLLGALSEVVLKNVPNLTARGVIDFLSQSADVRSRLRVLSIVETGIKATDLQDILTLSTNLESLAISHSVSSSIPSGAGYAKLSSRSLRTLRYEIYSRDPHIMQSATRSYYNYLASSILSGGFPHLGAVYVQDDFFPEHLMGIPPPTLPFGGGGGGGGSSTKDRPRSAGGGFSFPSSSSSSSSPPHHQSSPAKSIYGHTSSFSNDSNLMNIPTLLVPPSAPFQRGSTNARDANRFSSNNPFAGVGPLTRTLEVFTKSSAGPSWSFTKVDPSPNSFAPTPRRDNSAARPVSIFGLGTDVAGVGWDNESTRHSVMVSSGSGNFLALPPGADGPPGGMSSSPSSLSSRQGSSNSIPFGGDSENAWPGPRSSVDRRPF